MNEKARNTISELLDEISVNMYGISKSQCEKESICVFCHKKIDPKTEFRDAISLREYHISGICQKCQDKTFGV